MFISDQFFKILTHTLLAVIAHGPSIYRFPSYSLSTITQSNQGLGQLLNSFTVISPSWLNHCVALIDLRFFYTNTKIFGLDLDLMYVPNACV